MKRILVCDDEPHVVEGIRFLLRGPDRQIQAARDGQEALEQIKQEAPDLLITDIMMPRMSGLELVAALREDGAMQDFPIIILTARGQLPDIAAGQEVWGVLALGKPFEPRKLRELVTDALENGVCPPSASI